MGKEPCSIWEWRALVTVPRTGLGRVQDGFRTGNSTGQTLKSTCKNGVQDDRTGKTPSHAPRPFYTPSGAAGPVPSLFSKPRTRLSSAGNCRTASMWRLV